MIEALEGLSENINHALAKKEQLRSSDLLLCGFYFHDLLPHFRRW